MEGIEIATLFGGFFFMVILGIMLVVQEDEDRKAEGRTISPSFDRADQAIAFLRDIRMKNKRNEWGNGTGKYYFLYSDETFWVRMKQIESFYEEAYLLTLYQDEKLLSFETQGLEIEWKTCHPHLGLKKNETQTLADEMLKLLSFALNKVDEREEGTVRSFLEQHKATSPLYREIHTLTKRIKKEQTLLSTEEQHTFETLIGKRLTEMEHAVTKKEHLAQYDEALSHIKTELHHYISAIESRRDDDVNRALAIVKETTLHPKNKESS